MNKKYIRRLVEQVINEVVEDDYVRMVAQVVDEAHRKLNAAQRQLMMSGASESETFKRINQCDNMLLDLLNGR